MSKHGNGNAALATNPRAGESEIEACRRELAELRKAFATMALLVLPPNMRHYCACGQLASKQVDGVKTVGVAKSPLDAVAKTFTLCADCQIADEYKEIRRVELAPSERELVKLANDLGCLRMPSAAQH